ncbi:MAG: TldD/PmbA family protein [Alphaproteobacteria bacterium]|nr:TldD/PmbA family protein [Alphaproteobacteria bacterium]
MEKTEDRLHDLLSRAKKAGADDAEVLSTNAEAISVSVRKGTLEGLERSEAGDLSLRVFVGNKQAVVSSTMRDAGTLQALADRAVAMARCAPDDPFCGVAPVTASVWPDLDLEDPSDVLPEDLAARARRTEEGARAVAGVTNSAGAEACWQRQGMALATSRGFYGRLTRTTHSLSVSVLAGEGTAMQRDHDVATSVFAEDLPSPESVGTKAGMRAVARLHPRKTAGGCVPVFFEPRVGVELIGALAEAVSGVSVARGTSFLKDALGKKIFSDAITIVDDPHRPRGLRSRPFDGEGVATARRNVIDKGVLTTWLLDGRSARQLGMTDTGHAARAFGKGPSPSNMFIEAGTLDPEALMRDVAQGFYVTETMGMGINGVTGDYSQAASGFWIENGQKVFPVGEMTLAGNLRGMFLTMTAANDLVFERGLDTPTLRIDGMMVGGL